MQKNRFQQVEAVVVEQLQIKQETECRIKTGDYYAGKNENNWDDLCSLLSKN